MFLIDALATSTVLVLADQTLALRFLLTTEITCRAIAFILEIATCADVCLFLFFLVLDVGDVETTAETLRRIRGELMLSRTVLTAQEFWVIRILFEICLRRRESEPIQIHLTNEPVFLREVKTESTRIPEKSEQRLAPNHLVTGE
jgi:hypothetical protein